MGAEKAAKILALTGVEKSIFYIKRQLQSHWRSLDSEAWRKFCKEMSVWLSKDAPDEWDREVAANKKRKALDEIAAIQKLITESGPGSKGGKRAIRLAELKAEYPS